MEGLLFATTNKFKLKESREILSVCIDSVSLDLKEIQDFEVENVVIHKAVEAYRILKKPVIVDDSGLYFSALNGFPGAFIKSLMLAIGTNGSLKESSSKNTNVSKLLMGFENKGAYAKTSIAFASSDRLDEVIVSNGVIKGTIAKRCRGTNGFGWGDIFIPDGYDKTFAEMEESEKNKISMRKLALFELKKKLDINK